ncbi:MAG: Endopeptidase Clp ATP-binding chain B (ClpB), partial [Parcubacteria group bacterium GW2011_GWB1_52_7]
TPEVIRRIVEIQLTRVSERMSKKGISIGFSEPLRQFVAEKGYDSRYGARPLKRFIESKILNPLAGEVVSGGMGAGDSVLVDLSDGNAVFKKVSRQQIAPRKRVLAKVK